MLFELTLAVAVLASAGSSTPVLVQETDTNSAYPWDFRMDLPIEPAPEEPLALPGPNQVGRLYVLIAPAELGPAAVVVFDVPLDGPPVQLQTFETSITGSTDLGQQEPAVDPSDRFLFLPGGQGENIAVYELAGDGTIAEVPGSPFDAPLGSFQLAVHPEGDRLFNSQGSIDVQSFAISVDGALTLVDDATVFGSRDIAVTPDGSRLYATEGFQGARGFDIMPDGTLVELAESPFTFELSSRPFEIEIGSDSERLFINDLDSGVFAFDIESSGNLAPIPGSPFDVGGFSRAARLTEDDAYLYVATFSEGTQGFRVEPSGALTYLPGSPFDTPVGGALELLEVPERESLIFVRPFLSEIVTYDLLPDGSLVQDGPSAFVADPFDRQPIGAVFVSADVAPQLDCLDPVVAADPDTCTAELACDAIASCTDPGDDLVTLTCDPPAPYDPGSDEVFVTCADLAHEVVEQCAVTVEDTTPPVLTCSADPVNEDLGVPTPVASTPSASSAVHLFDRPRTTAAATGGGRVVDYDAFDSCGEVTVTAEIVSDLLDCGLPVTAGQVVDAECGDGLSVEIDGGEVEIEGAALTLVVTAVDAAGNISTCQVEFCSGDGGDDESDDEDDEDDED